MANATMGNSAASGMSAASPEPAGEHNPPEPSAEGIAEIEGRDV